MPYKMPGILFGLTSFRADVANWAWQPWNPGVWLIESPPLAHDPNWDPVDLDGNGVADFDRDNDNLPDPWEYRYSLNLRNGQDGNSDPDGDQLPNWQEYANGTNPRLADSDGDGFNDAVELWQGGDPVQQSSTPPLVLQVVDSSYQAIYTGQTTPALAVKVTQGGLPVAGVAVAFQLSEGLGRLKPASSAVGTPGSNLSQTTASNGIAAVTYELAAGEPEGTASISAGVAGASASQTFTVSIVPIPAAYGSAGETGSTGGGNVGATDLTRVPTPPRSTAMSAADIAAASADGYRIKVKRKLDTQSDYSKAFSEYLPRYGLDQAALVGYGFQLNGWANQTRLEFETLPLPPPPKKPVLPSGSRGYLVLVYEGENVATGPAGVPKYVGALGFHYTEKGARIITLTGNVPNKYIKTDYIESVTLEPPKGSSAGERAWVSLVQVEILQHPILATSGSDDPPATNQPIRFCRWLDAYPNGVRDDGFADKDRDRFQIHIPAIIPGLTKLKIKTTGLHGAVIDGDFQSDKTTDGDYEVDMKTVGEEIFSEPILLVSDGDDDVTFNGKGSDNRSNDQTLLADFGSQIVVTFPELGPAETSFQAQQPIGTVTLEMVYCAPKAQDSPPVEMPADMIPIMQLQARKMGEIYRQIGIKVNGYSISLMTFPDTWVQDNGPVDRANHLNGVETNDLMNLVSSHIDLNNAVSPNPSSRRIRVGFVNALMSVPESGAPTAGRAKDIGLDPCLVSIHPVNQRELNILPHEAGHVLKLPHNELYDPNINHWLMRIEAGDHWTNDSTAAKRFSKDEADSIKNSSYYVPAQ